MLKLSAADWKGREKPKKITKRPQKSVSNSSKLNFEQHLFQRAWASNIHLASNAVEVYARVIQGVPRAAVAPPPFRPGNPALV